MIGYYVHHVGRGHLQHARSIARQLNDEVTGLSSLPRPDGWAGEWVELSRDDEAAEPVDPTAYGHLHWAPIGDVGLRSRMATIAAWIDRSQPRALVADVSIEVTALARLMGVPIASMMLPGDRSDLPHHLGYALSDVLIAPWPGSAAGLSDASQPLAAKMRHVGAVSRFDGREPVARGGDGRRRVLVLQGDGGSDVRRLDLDSAARATEGWEWTALGGASGHWAADPWPQICQADVVVVHAGLNGLAEVAAARRPAIVAPQTRPHDEQYATARAIAAVGLAVVVEGWPKPAEWVGHLDQALRLGGERWSAWSFGDGAAQAARIIESVAARGSPRRSSDEHRLDDPVQTPTWR